jgi:membrane protease YdiL (CAAX protease family)
METHILQYWKFDSLLTFPKPFSLIIWSISILLILSLILGKYKFPKIHLNIIVWLIIGFISGIFTVLLIGYPGSLGIERSLLPYSFQQFISSLSPQLFFYQAGYAAVSEEPLFRGFLWGYLRKIRISNFKILLIQAFLFMVGHIYRIKTDPISLFIVVPIGAIILGILAWRSKTISTSIVTHATVNAIGMGVFRLFATLRM